MNPTTVGLNSNFSLSGEIDNSQTLAFLTPTPPQQPPVSTMAALGALWSSAKGALWSWLGVWSSIAVTVIVYALVRDWANMVAGARGFLMWDDNDNNSGQLVIISMMIIVVMGITMS